MELILPSLIRVLQEHLDLIVHLRCDVVAQKARDDGEYSERERSEGGSSAEGQVISIRTGVFKIGVTYLRPIW
jgi:hypothetical protein